jgi:hypothetical protein
MVAPTRIASERTTASTSSLCNVGLNIFPTAVVGSARKILMRFGIAARSGMPFGGEVHEFLFASSSTGLELDIGNWQFSGVRIGGEHSQILAV